MIVVPAGAFMMGSPPTEEGRFDVEGQQRRVDIARPFGVGIYNVTRGEYATFVKETGYARSAICNIIYNGTKFVESKDPAKNWRDPGFTQTDRDPVVCVSWNDAQAYLRWLNAKLPGAKEEGPYRLMSEAEYEYAERAGTTTPFYWGEQADHSKANYGGDKCCVPLSVGDDHWDFTSPVGSFPPNPFGLSDMAGNAGSILADCLTWWDASREKAPRDGAPYVQPDCKVHPFKGNSWDVSPQFLRAANVGGAARPESGGDHGGFRVAKTLK